MRAALSILGLVIALALVLNLAKKQAGSASRTLSVASPASAAAPAAVRQQLQDAAAQAGQRASEAQP